MRPGEGMRDALRIEMADYPGRGCCEPQGSLPRYQEIDFNDHRYQLLSHRSGGPRLEA
ncbi:hypothetical protein EMIT0P4_50124 [Pseudomonas sp. IT-P4]